MIFKINTIPQPDFIPKPTPNLSDNQISQLQIRGRNFLGFLGVLMQDRDDIIQDAFIILFKGLASRPLETHSEVADRLWRSAVLFAYWGAQKRQSRAVKFSAEKVLPGFFEAPEPPSVEELLGVLSDADSTILLALFSFEGNIPRTAKYLKRNPNSLYRRIGTIRKRLRAKFPEYISDSKEVER